MQCDGCYYQDRYENVCNHGSPIFDIEDNCTDYIEDDFVKKIREEERERVIKEIADLIIPLAKCKKGCKDKYCDHCMMEKLDKIEVELIFLKEKNDG